mgnify:CR=1 FL=1
MLSRATAGLARRRGVAPTGLDYLGQAVPEWMDGASLLDSDRVPDDRLIFGVSKIAEREMVATYFSALRSAGPPNYGAGSVTLVSGGALLLPFTKAAVPVVDVAQGRVVIDPPATVEAKGDADD